MNMHRVAGLPLVILLSLALCGQAPMAPSTPFVPDEYLDGARRLSGDSITFCASSASSLQTLDAALAEAIGAVQLVDVQFEIITYPFPAPPYEFWIGLQSEAIFAALSNDCDVFTGFALSNTSFPEWLTVSRPYLTTRYAIVAPGDAVALGDLPQGARVGALLGSSGDAVLAGFLPSQGEGRFRRIPFANYGSLLPELEAGTIDAAVVWLPALTLAAADGMAVPPVRILDGGPALPEIRFGMVVLAENTFLRGLLDDALATLTDSGELDALAVEHHLAASP